MTKQEIIQQLEKAKKMLNVAVGEDEKQHAQNKISKLEKELEEFESGKKVVKTEAVEQRNKTEKADNKRSETFKKIHEKSHNERLEQIKDLKAFAPKEMLEKIEKGTLYTYRKEKWAEIIKSLKDKKATSLVAEKQTKSVARKERILKTGKKRIVVKNKSSKKEVPVKTKKVFKGKKTQEQKDKEKAEKQEIIERPSYKLNKVDEKKIDTAEERSKLEKLVGAKKGSKVMVYKKAVKRITTDKQKMLREANKKLQSLTAEELEKFLAK